jgi:hypothetical protein
MASGPRSAYIAGMTTCAILIDTNIVLHFEPIGQIDWPTISGCSDCILVITPILMRELEQQKIFNRSEGLRERAGRMIDFLVQKMNAPDPIVLRPHVTLHFVDREPAIDFAANQLVREVQDDHYIAGALEYHAATRTRTFIGSNDGGMALKLRTRPIDNLRLPETLRLPKPVEAEQRELRDARLQIARMQAKAPVLSLRFPDGNRHLRVENLKAIPHRFAGPAEIRLEHPLLPMPQVPSATQPFDGDLASLGGLRGAFGLKSPAAVQRYNEQLGDFYLRYEQYAADMAAWLEKLRLSTEVKIEILNDGSATATDIDVTLRFPPTVTPMRSRDWPREPVVPKPPHRPGTVGAALSMIRDVPILSSLPHHFHDRDGTVYVYEEEREVRFSGASLKQKCSLRADTFLLMRDAVLAGRGIEVEADITYHEGEPVHQKLAITFTEIDPPPPDGEGAVEEGSDT